MAIYKIINSLLAVSAASSGASDEFVKLENGSGCAAGLSVAVKDCTFAAKSLGFEKSLHDTQNWPNKPYGCFIAPYSSSYIILYNRDPNGKLEDEESRSKEYKSICRSAGSTLGSEIGSEIEEEEKTITGAGGGSPVSAAGGASGYAITGGGRGNYGSAVEIIFVKTNFGSDEKCAKADGGDPLFEFISGVSAGECESKCRNFTSMCFGFSTSKAGNCLLWKEAVSQTQTQQGPSSEGWEGCWIRTVHRSRWAKSNSGPVSAAGGASGYDYVRRLRSAKSSPVSDNAE